MFSRAIFAIVIISAALTALIPLLAQDQYRIERSTITQALRENKPEEAESLLNQYVRDMKSNNEYDSLIYVILLQTEVLIKSHGSQRAIEAVHQLIGYLEKKDLTPLQGKSLYYNASLCMEILYDLREAYNMALKAMEYAEKIEENRISHIAALEYNLGVFSYKMSDMAGSEKHHRKSLSLKLADTATTLEHFYLSYNAVGSLCWHASKYDSAGYYYEKALDILARMPGDNVNKYYRPAIIKNNLTALYREEGRTGDALRISYEVLNDYQKFLQSDGADSKKHYALSSWCAAIDNLANIYQELGDYRKAEDLLLYAYQQKQSKLQKKHNHEVFISEILLGVHYDLIKDIPKARYYYDKGLARMSEVSGEFYFWEAYALSGLAAIHEQAKEYDIAGEYYDRADELYEKTYQGIYDVTFMEFLRNKSLFHARQNDQSKALKSAYKIVNYLKGIGEEDTAQGRLQQLNLAEIYYLTKDYKKSLKYSDLFLDQYNGRYGKHMGLLDSVIAEIHFPRAVLVRSKSLYADRKIKDSVFLAQLSEDLEDAVQVIERRRQLIDDNKSINLIMEGHKELISFYAKVSLDLYNLNLNPEHLENFINIREGGIYTRIRSRLSKQKAIQYYGIPESVIEEEQALKTAVQNALVNVEGAYNSMDNYRQKVHDWEKYLLKIRQEYPEYYQMRYATIFHTLPEMHQLIPTDITLVRYYLLDSAMVVLVADRENKRIATLDISGLSDKIEKIFESGIDERNQLQILYDLYKMIWAPIADDIKTERVVIIPDGPIYNISMDMLPFNLIHRYSELKKNSLLTKHIFSYQYSLCVLEKKYRNSDYDQNYIAFVPGFLDEMKNEYLSVVDDSMDIDMKYMTLLPQPSNEKLARKLYKSIGGEMYLNNLSTADQFREKAGDNKIIHVATHAEFNNAFPERSGLYFARSKKVPENNFVSLNEIYQYQLHSDLTILTACETGRPGYQDGEGLVSLAHAFNYAGSENILTALWKIDELSSAQITEFFVKNIKSGSSTDQALRDAKLAYLEKNQGRVLAPVYWSGLVLMGNPQVIDLKEKSAPPVCWILGVIILSLTGAGIFTLVKNQKDRRN